ncbi:SDR family NAD(P)-dependent oxidoreductase [Chloroflexota bacterium]
MQRFQQQVAIITGAASGIGLAIAKRLGSEGARILVIDVDAKQGKAAMAELGSHGIEAALATGDVGEEGDVEKAVNQAVQTWGRIDVLVNNAGIIGPTANLWEVTTDEIDRVYRTNLRGTFLYCKTVVPHMQSRGYGRIVNIASVAGKEGNAKMMPYSATKAAVICLTKSLGKELGDSGITVNCITPAIIRTPLLEQMPPQQVEFLISKIPMGRTGELEEVAALTAWLTSSECSFSTGAVFDISGGRATY